MKTGDFAPSVIVGKTIYIFTRFPLFKQDNISMDSAHRASGCPDGQKQIMAARRKRKAMHSYQTQGVPGRSCEIIIFSTKRVSTSLQSQILAL